MLSVSELKEGAKHFGVPATGLGILMILFQTGLIPSSSSRAYDAVGLLSSEIHTQEQIVELIVKQHGEQMEMLMQGMREICFNTAKTQDRERACANLQHNLSTKP